MLKGRLSGWVRGGAGVQELLFREGGPKTLSNPAHGQIFSFPILLPFHHLASPNSSHV